MKIKKTRYFVSFFYDGEGDLNCYIVPCKFTFTSSKKVINEDGENAASWVLQGPNSGLFTSYQKARKFVDFISANWKDLIPKGPILRGVIDIRDGCLIFHKDTGDPCWDIIIPTEVPVPVNVKCSI